MPTGVSTNGSRNGHRGQPKGIATARPPIGEQGSFDPQAMVDAFANGLFALASDGIGSHVDRPSVLDLENMLLRDNQARGLETVLTLPIRATTFRIEEAEGDSGEAEFARGVLLKPARMGGMRTPISRVVAQMCAAFARRASFFEKAWEIRPQDGALVYDKLAFRRASTCEVVVDAKTRSYAGFAQEGFTGGPQGQRLLFGRKHFPPIKALVYVHGASSTDPMEGESAFEAAYRAYVNKQKLEMLRFLYLQKFGIPPLEAHTDSSNPDEQKEMLKKANKLRSGSAVVTGPGESFNTVTAAQTVGGSTGGTADFRETIRYLDSQMATSMLAGFLQLPTGNQTASYALSRDQSDLFLLSCEARQREIEEALTDDALADLIYHNFGRNAAYPRFKMTALSLEHEAKALELYKATLSTGSAPPLPVFLANLIRDKGLAAVDINQDAIRDAEEAARQGLAPANPAERPAGQNAPTADQAAGALEKAVGQLLSDTQENDPFAELVETLAEEILEFVYNPTKQVRDPYGRFGGSNAPTTSHSRTNRRPGFGGAVGGGSRKSVDSPPKGGAKPKGAPKPAGVASPPKKAGQSSGTIALPTGESVALDDKPPAGAHFLMAGLRSGDAHVVFFGLDTRELTREEVSYVAREGGGIFDVGEPDFVGRFDPDSASATLVSVHQAHEGTEGLIEKIREAYGPALSTIVVDGKPQDLPQAAPQGAPQQTTPPAPA